MPVGPLHLGFTLPVFARFKAKLEFLPLAIGSFIPDIELLLMWPVMGSLEAARGPMHSLLGALTIDVVFALLYAHFVGAPLISWFKSKYPNEKTHLFAGIDASQRRMPNSAVVYSALIGTVSHVLIDLFSHDRNPIFWPWDMGEGLHLMPFAKFPSSVLMHALAAILLYWVARKYWLK